MNKTKLYMALRLICHNGDNIKQNEVVALTEAQAAPLLALNPPAIVEAKGVEPQDKVARAELITTAMNQLDTENPSLWTQSGKPYTEALSELVGFEVTAAERDELWASVVTANKNS